MAVTVKRYCWWHFESVSLSIYENFVGKRPALKLIRLIQMIMCVRSLINTFLLLLTDPIKTFHNCKCFLWMNNPSWSFRSRKKSDRENRYFPQFRVSLFIIKSSKANLAVFTSKAHNFNASFIIYQKTFMHFYFHIGSARVRAQQGKTVSSPCVSFSSLFFMFSVCFRATKHKTLCDWHKTTAEKPQENPSTIEVNSVCFP